MNSIDILAICMIVTSLAVFGLRNLKLSIGIYAIQTLLLVSIFFMLYSNFNAPQLRIWAIVAFFTKVIFVPGILFWLVKKLDVISEDEPVGGFFVSPVIAMGISLAIAMTINPILLKFSLIQERIVLKHFQSIYGGSSIYHIDRKII